MRTAEYITPNCCDKAKQSKAVRLGLYPKSIEFGEWKDSKPKWWIAGDRISMDEHFNIKIEIEQCPFCHKTLPEIEKSNILNIAEGDEEYCDTCGERHMCCDCYPPEYRWKVKE